MRWRECTIGEALRHASTRTIENESFEDKDVPGDKVLFTDGTAIACESKYGAAESGAWAESPNFWIGEL